MTHKGPYGPQPGPYACERPGQGDTPLKGPYYDHFYVFLYFLYFGLNRGFNELKTSQKRVKLNFLSAALDPQEMARGYWSYEGFMPIFWFGLIVWMCKFLGF